MEPKDSIYRYLGDSYETFRATQEFLILIERFAGEKVPIGPINELRGCIYHLYKVVGGDDTDENLAAAKEHLHRAFFDSYSILCSILINHITDAVNAYKQITVATVFRNYHDVIVPTIILIQQEITSLRKERDTKFTSLPERVSKQVDHIKFLIAKHGETQSLVGHMATFEKESNIEAANNNRQDWTKQIVIGTILIIVGLILGFVFSRFIPA